MGRNILLEAIANCEQILLTPSLELDQFQAVAERIGNILQSNGHFDDAVIWHTQAQQPEPDLAEVYMGLGRIYWRQEQWEKAIAAYQQVLHLNPDLEEPHWKLVSIYQHQNQQQAALNHWYQALAFSPNQATPQEHVKFGHALLKMGQKQEALNCYRRAIYVEPDYVPAYRELADAYLKLGNQNDAIAIYQEAIKRVSKPGVLYHKLAQIFQTRGEIDQAMATFEAAIAHDPGYRWNYHGKIQLLIQQQRWSEVIAACNATLDQHPDTFWVYTQMGRTFLSLGNKARAIACHQRACALQGWPRAETNDYQFSQDCFSPKIPLLLDHLYPLVDQPAIKALEVGSFEGLSACWFLDHVLTHSTAHLTCIDRRFQSEFDQNIAKTGATARVTQLTGFSENLVPTLPDNSFDLIYIDGAPTAEARQKDGEQAWSKLKVGGMIIFAGYDAAKLGIDALLRQVKDEMKVLHRHRQVIVQKITLKMLKD